MLTTKINPSVMSSNILRTQYIKLKAKQPVENSNVHSVTNEEVNKQVNAARILPANNVNVMYVASAFHKLPPVERSYESIWA